MLLRRRTRLVLRRRMGSILPRRIRRRTTVLLVRRVGRRSPVLVACRALVLRVVRRAIRRIRFRERPESSFRIAFIGRRRIYPRLFGRHRRSVIFPARSPGRDGGMAAEITRPGGGCNCRAPMIFRREVLAILAGCVLVLGLRRQRSGVLLVRGCLFLRRRTRLNSALPAVVAHRPGIVHHHRVVVDVSHVRDADIGDGAVVVERSAAPLAADESHAGVPEAIVNAAVEADVRAPVPGVPRIEPPAPAPVSGRPQHAHRSHHPRSGHPVVAGVIIPAPVPGRPEIARPRADRLRVHRQRRRAHANRNAYRDLRKGRGRKR